MPGKSDSDDSIQTRRSDGNHLHSAGGPRSHKNGGLWSLPAKGDGKPGRAPGICFSWPSGWGENGGAATGGGCRFESPWIIKSLTSVGALAFDKLRQSHRELTSPKSLRGLHRSIRFPGNHLFPLQDAAASISKAPLIQQVLPQVKAGIMKLIPWEREAPAASTSKDELGELEERALAQALAVRKPATVIEFYSPRCTLCRSLVTVVTELERKHEEWLHIVMVDVENKRWLPEVLLYDIKYVPCFLLLDSHGNALVKTGVPYSRKHVLQGLSYLLESMKPIKNRVKYVRKDSETSSSSS